MGSDEDGGEETYSNSGENEYAIQFWKKCFFCLRLEIKTEDNCRGKGDRPPLAVKVEVSDLCEAMWLHGYLVCSISWEHPLSDDSKAVAWRLSRTGALCSEWFQNGQMKQGCGHTGLQASLLYQICQLCIQCPREAAQQILLLQSPSHWEKLSAVLLQSGLSFLKLFCIFCHSKIS